MIRLYSAVTIGVVAMAAWMFGQEPATIPAMALTSVTDSGDYFVYEYAVSNGSSSNTSISGIVLDVADPGGSADSVLAATGDFLNTGSFGSIPFDPHVPVGPSSPVGWKAILGQGARLSWHAPVLGFHETDSIAPGDTLTGFVVRSPYLPEVRDFEGWPIYGDCCEEPDTVNDNGHPDREDFATTGETVGPGVEAADLDIDVLQTQLSTVCDDPLWITSAGLCDDYSDSVDVAEARLGINNYEGAGVALFSTELAMNDDFAGGSGDIHPNAYWMLNTNLKHVRESLPQDTPGGAEVCVKGPEQSRVRLAMSATGGGLNESTPYRIDIEEIGVDPAGSSCVSMWNIVDGDTLNVDFSVHLDSLDAGLEVDRVFINGGLAGDTTIVAQDSVMTSHDGITYAMITFQLKSSQ